jgi:hypothetical protein
MVAVMALTAAMKAGLITLDVMRRTTGLILGAAAILVGNVLPKVRPLTLLTGNANRSRTAERFAGWVLVLAGAVYIGSFLFAPVPEAKRISSIAGVVALLLIAISWTPLAFRGADALVRPPEVMHGREPRKVMLWLVLAFFYVFATACFGWMFGMAWWSVIVFWLAYAALSALIERRMTAP